MGIKIVALHGFLGAPGDWQAVQARLPSAEWIIPDYTHDPLLNPHASDLGVWGKNFRTWLKTKNLSDIVLAGYSQGGRLAMHALKESSDLVRVAVVISAQPGFPDTDMKAREARRAHDEGWALKFEKESWAETIQAWNAQEIFKTSAGERNTTEAKDSRNLAAACMRHWSVSHQKDMRPVIKENAEKIVWVTGGKDAKYLQLANELEDSMTGLRIEKIANAGHRVPMDAPAQIAAILSSL